MRFTKKRIQAQPFGPQSTVGTIIPLSFKAFKALQDMCPPDRSLRQKLYSLQVDDLFSALIV